MQKKVFLYSLMLFFSLATYGQSESWSDDLLISQKEGTNELLVNYLSPVKSRSDTVYAVLFCPSYCPRCEAVIPSFIRDMKKLYPQNETVLISTYGDSIAARHYIRKHSYHFDHYLFDTEADYSRIFSFNSHGMTGLYILKLDKKNGRMIIGGEPYDYNEKFVNDLHNQVLPMPYNCYESGEDKKPVASGPADYHSSLSYETYPLTTDSLFPVSGVYGMPLVKDDIFVYTDELASAAYYFRINKNTREVSFVQPIEADSIERDMYADIPREMLESERKGGQIFYIALSPNFVGEGNIGLSYSLPRLFMKTPTLMAYYNRATIITRDARTLEKQPVVPLDFNVFNESYMYLHFSFFPLTPTKIVLGCQKNTWPMEFEPEDYKGKPDFDSFMDEFYDREAPYLAIFDVRTGKLVQRFGKMEPSQRLSRTGYYYLNPIAEVHGKELIYGNGYTGQLHLADVDNPGNISKSISVFEIDTEHFPPLDSTAFYKIEYARAYDGFFNRNIEAVALTDKTVHCLVSTRISELQNIQGYAYEYVSVDRATGKVTRFPLKKENESERQLAYGLARIKGEVYPYYFAKQGERAFLKFITSDKMDKQ